MDMDVPIRFGGIYLWRNRIDGKEYVGLVRDCLGRGRHFVDRKNEHRRVHKHEDYPLYRAMRKHGYTNFEFSALETYEDFTITPRELDDREIYHITERNTLLPNGYNIEKGGSKGRLGVKLSIDVRESLAISRGGNAFVAIDIFTSACVYSDPDTQKPWVSMNHCAEALGFSSRNASIKNILSKVCKGRAKRPQMRIENFTFAYINEDQLDMDERVKNALENYENNMKWQNIRVYEVVTPGVLGNGTCLGTIQRTWDVSDIISGAHRDCVCDVISGRTRRAIVDGKVYTFISESSTDDETSLAIERACNPHNQRPFRVYDRHSQKPVNDKLYYHETYAANDLYTGHWSCIGKVLSGKISHTHGLVPIYDDLTDDEIKTKLNLAKVRFFCAYKYDYASGQWIYLGDFTRHDECASTLGFSNPGDVSQVLCGKTSFAKEVYIFAWKDDDKLHEKMRALEKKSKFASWYRQLHLVSMYLKEHDGTPPRQSLRVTDRHGVRYHIGEWFQREGNRDWSKIRVRCMSIDPEHKLKLFTDMQQLIVMPPTET